MPRRSVSVLSHNWTAFHARLRPRLQVFYTVGECKPRVFNTFLLANLAPPGPQSEAKWLQIAQRTLTMLSDAEVRVGPIGVRRAALRLCCASHGA